MAGGQTPGAPACVPLRCLSVAVIGAGAAGLVTARELLREGHHVTVYEKAPAIGGVWEYSDAVESDPLGADPGRRRVHATLYAGLRTNTTRENMSFSDYFFDASFPGAADSRQFCSHAEVLRFLQAFAAAFDLLRVVRTCVEVLAVRPAACSEIGTNGSTSGGAAAGPGSGQGRWEVVIKHVDAAASGDGASSRLTASEVVWHDAVVVCNGHFFEPRVPSFPGQAAFPGLLLHSHNYRRPEPFANQTVLLVGAASSGSDMAQELAGVGARVYLGARVWENPLTGEVLQLDTSVTREAQSGQVVKCANLRELRADGSAVLDSGVALPRVDVVILCTGYSYSFPFLEGAGIVSVEDNRVGPLYQHVFPPAHAPFLSFVGLPFKVIPFPQMELQAKWIARALSGRVTLPSREEVEAEVQRFYAKLEVQGIPQRYTHRQAGDLQWEYNDWLADACGPDVPCLAAWRRQMYAATGASRQLHGDAYRDWPLPGGEVCEAAARQEAAAVRAALAHSA